MPRHLTPYALVMALLLTAVLSAGCGYRLRSPQPLGEPLAVSVVGSQARLVRSQAMLHEEVGRAIRSRLGWELNPTAEATLNILVERENIDSAARDVDGITIRWSVVLRATVVLRTSNHGVLTSPGPFVGVGYSAGRGDEAKALRDAAKNLSSQVADWLEHEAARWHPDAAPDEIPDHDHGEDAADDAHHHSDQDEPSQAPPRDQQ